MKGVMHLAACWRARRERKLVRLGWARRGLTLRPPARLLLLIAALASCGAQPVAVDDAMLADEADGTNWPAYGRTYSENHYSPLKQMDDGNIGRVGLAWSHDLGTPLRADSQPLAVDGVIYLATGLSIVTALDAETGKMLWRHDPAVAESKYGGRLIPGWGSRGLAIWKNKVIVGLQDGRLLALDRQTGKPVWEVQTLDEKVDKYGEATITGAPRVFNGKVIIGFGGGDRWARGAVSAFDAETGKFLWRFFTVPGNPADGFEDEAMAMAARSWSGEWWTYGGGGTAWNAIAYDPDYDRVYIGTGNGGPWNWKIRNPEGGDNLFLASIVALDAKTGKYVWHYQQNPNEAWDYNAVMDMELATLTIDGKPRKVLMQAPKNGFFYVIDRETGKLISAGKIDKVTWAERIDVKSGRPVDTPGNRYEKEPVLLWPGPMGAHNWQAMAFSPATALAYIPGVHQAGIYSDKGIAAADWQRTAHAWNTGLGGDSGGLKVDRSEFSSWLQAWDPVKQQVRWKVKTPGILNGGTMATAGNLLFQGHIDGTFNAFNALDGRKLWTFRAGVSVLGAPISFLARGVQYVAVLSGPPSGAGGGITSDAKFGWRYRDHPRRLLVFRIGGTARLPPTAAPGPAQPLQDKSFRVDAKLAVAGAKIYGNHCASCHGSITIAAGGAPDLRASPAVIDAATFRTIVRDGALKGNGMPTFDFLSDNDLLAVRHYIRQQAGTKAPAADPIRLH
jgi:quinohemoprotein ethanol dehydrogenase